MEGKTISIAGAGTTTITAVQMGNDEFEAAKLSQIPKVNKAEQSLTFPSLLI